ncbi:hypothetical protein VTK56DRAFT_3759 [Thermocarpiscus australiensis]
MPSSVAVIDWKRNAITRVTGRGLQISYRPVVGDTIPVSGGGGGEGRIQLVGKPCRRRRPRIRRNSRREARRVEAEIRP